MKTLSECGDEYQQFLQCPDDVFVFSKGACHAFALELEQWFQASGYAITLFYVSSEHPEIAKHVVTQVGGLFWDVFGKHTADELAKTWADCDTSRILPVGQVGWISVGSHTPTTSYLGLLVSADFLAPARQRAHAYIEVHAGTFSL